MGECKSLPQHAHVGNTGGWIQDHHFRTFQRRLIWRFANRNCSPGEVAAARFKFALIRKEFLFRSVDSRVHLKYRLNLQSSMWKGTTASRCTQADNRLSIGCPYRPKGSAARKSKSETVQQSSGSGKIAVLTLPFANGPYPFGRKLPLV
jgi:hypothetical protein